MAQLSDYTENLLVQWFARNTAVAARASGTWNIRLYTVAPTEAGTGGTEVSGGAYAARTLAATSGGLTITSNVITNASDVEFPVATANWGTVVAAAVWDAASAGNMLFLLPLTSSITINSGSQLRFPVGNISLTID